MDRKGETTLLEEQRKLIVEIGLKMVRDGVAHNGQGNISVYDHAAGLMAITPSAVPYEVRKPEDICVVEIDGKLIHGKWKPTSEMELHLIYYRSRKDVNAVIHTHAPYTTVFGVIGESSMPVVLNEAAMVLGGTLPVAPYARPGTPELAEVTYNVTGEAVGVIMAHHGLITTGIDLNKAYEATLTAESTARCIIMARSMGVDVAVIDPEEVTKLREMYLGYRPHRV